MKFQYSFLLLFAGILSARAQVVDGSFGYYNDALFFSQTNPLYGSTARIQSIGGTQTSLGGDLSLAGSNPAGLGFFNKSVMSFTPSMNFHTTDANFLGTDVSTFKNNFNFANLGVAINSNKGDYTNEKFKGGSFAITLNRTNNFNNEVTYQGQNQSNSIIDYFLQDAGTSDPYDLSGSTYDAFVNYLINPIYDSDSLVLGYESFVTGNPRETETIQTYGSQYQWNFSWGGNYDDKIYFGAGLGVASVNYTIKRNYQEDNYLSGSTVSEFINYTRFREKLDVEGTGINATVGLIARPVPVLTVGVSYTTPTYYALSDRSSRINVTSWNNVDYDGEILNDLTYDDGIYISDYSLRTPSRLSLGATAFLGKIGFISGDVDFIDYSTSQLKSSDFEPFADNQTVRNLYTNTVNYRLGGEIRVDNFRFRGGYNYQDDPYKSGDDTSRSSITYGVGYRTKDYYVDLGIINARWNSQYSPYTFQDGSGPVANVQNKSNTASVTVGFNF